MAAARPAPFERLSIGEFLVLHDFPPVWRALCDTGLLGPTWAVGDWRESLATPGPVRLSAFSALLGRPAEPGWALVFALSCLEPDPGVAGAARLMLFERLGSPPPGAPPLLPVWPDAEAAERFVLNVAHVRASDVARHDQGSASVLLDRGLRAFRGRSAAERRLGLFVIRRAGRRGGAVAEEAIAALRERLRTRRAPAVQVELLFTLGEVAATAAAGAPWPEVASWATDPHPAVRAMVASADLWRRAALPTDTLAALCADARPAVRLAALAAVGRAGGVNEARWQPVLAAGLRHPDPATRAAAAGVIGGPSFASK